MSQESGLVSDAPRDRGWLAFLAFRLLRRRTVIHAIVLLTLTALLGYITYQWRKAARTKADRSAAIGVFKLKPGPWGDVSCIPITISPPLEFIPESLSANDKPLAWKFPRMNRDVMSQYLAQVTVSEPLRQALLKDAQSDPETGGLVVYPSRERVLGLSNDDRAHLYFGLSQFAENREHVKAFRFCGENVGEWFHDVHLSPRVVKLVTPLVYRIGSVMFFADLRTIERDISTTEERRLLVKALSEERTFLMRLNVSASSNIDALIQYWGRRGQAKDIRPILESLAGINSDDEGEELGISHLLPPFARRRVYTYPVPAETLPAINRDCHWTALNFFEEAPNDAYCDPVTVAKTIVADYHRIYSDFRVGDLALFVNGPDSYIHSEVYVADDVYFTKNGSLSTRPWMLMRLNDLKDYYPSLSPLEVRHYRRNEM